MERKPLPKREIQFNYRIPSRTLDGWINLGVIETYQGKLDGKGAVITLISPEQQIRLERFLRCRNWFVREYKNEKSQIQAIISLLDTVDEDIDEAIEILARIEHDFQDRVEGIQLEIQSLYAQKSGDPEIDPLQSE